VVRREATYIKKIGREPENPPKALNLVWGEESKTAVDGKVQDRHNQAMTGGDEGLGYQCRLPIKLGTTVIPRH